MKVISEQINKTQKLTSGLKNNLELLKDKGLDEKFIRQLEIDNDFVKTKNEEIDSLKAETRLKTKLLNLKLIEVKMQVKRAKKVIKSNFEKNSWKDFGVTDKR